MSWRARFVIWVLVALGLLSIAMSFATAQEPPQEHCGIRLAVLFRLKETFHELPVFQGASNNGGTIIVTLSDAKTWTVLACDLHRCCVKAAGTSSFFLPGA